MNQFFSPKDPNFSEKVLTSFSKQRVMQTIGAELLEVKPGEVTIRLPFNLELTQQHEFIHAGIITTVLDSACGYAAFSLMPVDAEILSIEFKTNLLTPAKGEFFMAKARVVKPGRNISVVEGSLFAVNQNKEKLVATMTGTMMAVYDREGVSS